MDNSRTAGGSATSRAPIVDPMEIDDAVLDAMVAEIEDAGGVLGPSEFWDRLGSRNAATLRADGLDSFKRSVNFNYFQWVINSPRQPEFRSLMRTWARRPTLAALGARVCVDDVDWDRPKSPRQLPIRYRARGHALYVGMLWDVARRRVGASVWSRLQEPELGKPIAVRCRGRRVSEDLANSLNEYASIAEHVPAHRMAQATVLEIGAGYGRFADLVLRAHDDTRVVIVDIPPALALSEAYLTACHPHSATHRFRRGMPIAELARSVAASRLAFLTPNQFAELDPIGADVAVNVSSLHEMRTDQVAEYLRLVDGHAGGGFFYTKQWASWRNPVDGIQTDRRSYPYPKSWRCLFDRAPVAQPAFFEALFAV
jgi:putative sugar O-methyltransferase